MLEHTDTLKRIGSIKTKFNWLEWIGWDLNKIQSYLVGGFCCYWLRRKRPFLSGYIRNFSVNLWRILMKVKSYELCHSYQLNSSLWTKSPNLLGLHAMDAPQNCLDKRCNKVPLSLVLTPHYHYKFTFAHLLLFMLASCHSVDCKKI